MEIPDLVGLPWPQAKQFLDDSGMRYDLKETFAPREKGTKPVGSPGLVVRVSRQSDGLEIVVAYPIWEPKPADLL